MSDIGFNGAASFREKRTDRQPPAELFHSPHWFACRTRSRAEKKAVKLLDRLGIESYLPLVEEERQWSDRTRRGRFPLFLGYVFARFDLRQIHHVLGLPPIATVARPSGYPTPVREEELDSVRRLVAGVEETGTIPKSVDYMAPGDHVIVVGGPFEGMQAVLLDTRRHARVAIRIPALRQASSVQVPREFVRLVKGRSAA